MSPHRDGRTESVLKTFASDAAHFCVRSLCTRTHWACALELSSFAFISPPPRYRGDESDPAPRVYTYCLRSPHTAFFFLAASVLLCGSCASLLEFLRNHYHLADLLSFECMSRDHRPIYDNIMLSLSKQTQCPRKCGFRWKAIPRSWRPTFPRWVLRRGPSK